MAGASRLRACIFIAALVLCVSMGGAGAHDKSRPDLDGWFNGLKSANGPCCSDRDGTVLADPDWESLGDRYRVKLNGVWYDVPEAAVITEKNRAGVAMVWPMTDGVTIRCFLPGSLA